MRTDYLVLLLSSDCFFDLWSEIGIDLPKEAKQHIQSECRQIVKEFVAGATNFYQIDLSDERRGKTYLALIGLLKTVSAKDSTIKATEAWLIGAEDDLRSAMMLRLLSCDLRGRQEADLPKLSLTTKAKIDEIAQIYKTDQDPFLEISVQSDWDEYIQSLFTDTPTALSDIASFVAQVWKMKEFWARIRQRLTEGEIQNLLSWYRTAAKAQGLPIDPVPSYII